MDGEQFTLPLFLPATVDEYRVWYKANIPEGVKWGECWCGCRLKTRIPDRTHGRYTTKRSWEFKGLPLRYFPHHTRRGRLDDLYRVEDRGYTTPCWIANRPCSSGGYAAIKVNHRTVPVHRFMYERKYGPIPNGLPLDHLCVSQTKNGGSIRCCNPDHLEIVTVAINSQRRRDATLNRESAREIRRLGATGDYTQRALARRFGVTQATIGRVLRNEAWKDI